MRYWTLSYKYPDTGVVRHADGLNKGECVLRFKSECNLIMLSTHPEHVFREMGMRGLLPAWSSTENLYYRKPKMVLDGPYLTVPTMGPVAALTVLEKMLFNKALRFAARWNEKILREALRC